MMTTTDSAVRATIRADLSPEVFARRPMRCLLLVPLLALVVGGSVALLTVRMPWYLSLAVAITIGNFYATMMFLGHEIGHGAAVRSTRLQDVLMYPGCAIFCLSPHLWRIWHNTSHHAHTNSPDEDPDTFGTLSNFLSSSRATRNVVRRAPGSRSWSSALYLFTFFTLQAQTVLWAKSRTLPGYRRLRRRRAAIDSGLLGSFWVLVSLGTGIRGAVFVVLIPMLVANFVVLSYVVTNHMLRPLSDTGDTLGTTMSVRTFRPLDRLHLHFSHHVEHHLFPRLASSMTPHVRRSLVRHYGDHYLAPPHGVALLWIFRTPRLYDDFVTLVDPDLDRRVDIGGVEGRLRVSSSLARGL